MKRLLNYTRRLIDGMLPERNARCSPTDAQNTTGSFDSLYKVGKKLSSKPHHGIAYEGIRKSDDKQVIIKSVKNHLFDFHMEDSKPLCREAAIMQMVQHTDHVVKLHEWFGMKDHDILIMEHPGASTTLFDHIKANGGRLDEAEANDFMQKLIAALRHCSEQDVYYKGLSLKKVLIDPNTRKIKLTGFYRALTTRETRKGDRKSSGERRIHALMETNKGLHRVLKGMVKGEWFHGKNTDLSKECLDLLRELRHRESWITLQNILDHDWFKETPDPDATESEPTDGVCDSVENLHKTEKDKTSSSEDQTSQHVTSTSEAEVLPIAEEPGHAKVDDEWTDDSFQDLVRDCRDDAPQVTDCATSDCGVNNVHVGPTGDTVSPPLKKLEDNMIIDTGFYSYEIGRKLGEGAYGCVYAGIRLKDGLEVALKFTHKVVVECIDIEGHPEAVPKEIGLLILANKGPRVPQIIQLLDWVEVPEGYIMVLELPKPCENLFEFYKRLEGYIEESTATVIMQQVTLAVQACSQRGVLHRDIKLRNLLINPDTLEVKLIDFGCGEILTNVGYTSYAGTVAYCPPEYKSNGMYHGEPATVWSLGILLFVLMCGQFPESEEFDKLNDNIWTKEGLSQECCELLCSLLQRNPEKRLELDSVCRHIWFKKFKCQPENNEIIDTGFYSYEIVRKLGEGAYGCVYAGIRLKDGLEMVLKIAHKVGIEWIDIEGHPEPVPQEIGLLILANKGPRVPQIIQLLDWVEEPERYIMVLELPKPYVNLFKFYEHLEGYIGESTATVIMQQVTLAAQTCCQRGVLHRDINLGSLAINPDTLEVKLIDFGCAEILTNVGYTSYAGTEAYCPPEYKSNGMYHGEPATVWSLGILLFVLMCGQFPESEEFDKLNDNIWTKEGLSQECCELLCSLLQRNPEKRLELDSVCRHNWFKKFKCQPENNEIIDTGFYSYEIVRKLGEGAYGCVYAGIRLKDGLEVALKFAHKVGIECIDIEGHPEPVPKEIGLLILANKGPRVPQIIQLLDWVEVPEGYIMVLELPKPCENLFEFFNRLRGYIGESTATVIMQQVTLAAQACCQRGVLHRDIKLENLLINPDTLEVNLIDFGCGEILTNAGYTSYAGTEVYCPPEYKSNGMYHGEPATVWSLGMILFVLMCGQFPESEELDELNDNIWTKEGLSQECCELLCSLLQRNPEKRLELDSVCRHNWFKKFKCQPENNEIIEKAPERRKIPGCFLRLWKATKGVFSSSSSSAVNVVEPFIPPADPVLEPSSPAPVHSGVKTNNEKAPERRKIPGCFLRLWKATKGVFSSSSSSAVNVVEPFIPPADPVLESSSPAPVHSGVKPNNGYPRSWRTASTDSSPGITSSSAWSLPQVHVERRCRESLSLCSRGSDGPNQQGLSRSDSLEVFLCPPLPGQVPFEPKERSTGRTAQGAVECQY